MTDEATLADQLAEQPWLEPFVADEDGDLNPARLRFRSAQADYGRYHGVAVRHRHGAVLTTSLDLPQPETPR